MKRRPPTPSDPSVYVDGRALVKIDGVWCARTKGGSWRSAVWLGSVNVPQLLDILATGPQPDTPDSRAVIVGQLDMFPSSTMQS